MTPTPTSSTTPATSQPTVNGSSAGIPPRARTFQSTGFTPAAATRTSTSVGPGSGRGRSSRTRTSGPPSVCCRTARIRCIYKAYGRACEDERVPEPVRDRDPTGVRGLGGDVSVPRALRRGPARGRREPLLVLELDALPGTDARVRRPVHRRPLPGARRVAEPLLCAAGRDGDRLPDRQRLRLHLRQPGHRPGEDRRAGRRSSSAAPATTSRTGTTSTRASRRRWRC